MKGLDVDDKAVRVASFHHKTVEASLELVGAAGLTKPTQLRPRHIWRRISATEVKNLGEIYPTLKPGQLLDGPIPEPIAHAWRYASATSF